MQRSHLLGVVRGQLERAVAAKKCHSCGCLQSTVSAIMNAAAGSDELAVSLASARRVFAPTKYDCLGCAECFPAIAANAFAEAFPDEAAGLDLCPTEAPEERSGWPPLPGDFEVLRYQATVAACALNSSELVKQLAARRPSALSIVGTMHTENLGIERVIKNVLANPNIRSLMLCGEDTQQAIGHLPGQSLLALAQNGVDDSGRIVGAKGKRPVLKNVTDDQIRAFLDQVEIVDLIGENDIDRVVEAIERLGARVPPRFEGPVHARTFPTLVAEEPRRLVLDPAGFFVVYPDMSRQRLVVEHYTKDSTLNAVIEGRTPAALYATIAERGLVTRLDHAAYLGRELARAERSLETGEPYVQDRAAGMVEDEVSAESCGCRGSCGASS